MLARSALGAAAAALLLLSANAQAQQSPGVAEPPQAATGRGITPTGELINMTGDELTGRQVLSNDGDTLGKVRQIAVGQADNVPHAVIRIGGFLGFGGTQVALPFDLLRLQGDDIYLTRTFDEGQLKAQYPFSEARYRAVAGDQVIAEAIGSGQPRGVPTPPETRAAASFDSLDENRDGYVTMSEAVGNDRLLQGWGEVDRNGDGMIDRAEFSAFEQAPQQPQGPGATAEPEQPSRPEAPR